MKNNNDKPVTESNYSEAESQAQWYVINTNKGHEKRVREDLKQKIETLNLKDKIFEIIIVEAFPGYLFIKMIMTDDTWYYVRNTPGVTGFIGSSGRGVKPLPLGEKDVNTMIYRDKVPLKKEANVKKDKRDERDFELNDYVMITTGALKDREGQVTQLDDDKGVVTVNIDFLGRSMAVKVEYICCKKFNS